MKNLRLLILVIILLGMRVHTVSAGNNVLGLDENNSYDIYIAESEDRLTVIKNIRIVGSKDVFGKTFLVIQTDTFNVKDSEGLIMFDQVRAILPANKIIPVQVNKINRR